MLEVILLVSLAATAAVVGMYHSRPGSRIRTQPVRLFQTLIFSHAPAFAGFLLAGLSDPENVFAVVVAAAGAVLYGGSYAVLSYSDAFKRWPFYLILLSLGASLVLFSTAGVQKTEQGRVGLVLVHAALYHFSVADGALEAT